MEIHFGKFIHTETGKRLMSVLLGLGLATLFRSVCQGSQCNVFHAAPLEEFKDKIYKSGDKCVKYVAIPAKCSLGFKTVTFE